jgi:hypothetical protein
LAWPKTNVLCQGAYRTFSGRCSWNPMYVQLSRRTNDERGVKLGYLPNMG